MIMRKLIFIIALLSVAFVSFSQVSLPYMNMDSWIQRDIKESKIIGGEVKTLYEVGKPCVTKEAAPWVRGDSPWETSSIYANVVGISKVSSTVFPEKRGNGYCARLETRLEEVYALGFIHITALATGSLFVGHLIEPIRNINSPMAKMVQGVPFTHKIKALKFDYKAKTGGKRIKASALKKDDVEGPNNAEICVFLQKRWNEDGKLKSKRIATAYIRIEKSTDWVNGYELKLHYGDITKEPYYKEYMSLNYQGYPLYGLNDKGENVPIDEVGWGGESDNPTHIIIRFSSGYGGAYVGAVGDCLWIDNIEFVM